MTATITSINGAKALRKLDVGAGAKYEEGWETMDLSPAYSPDFAHDITQFPWPFADGDFDELRCWHVLEHLPATITQIDWEHRAIEYTNARVAVMNEMHRILKPGGRLSIEVPIFPFWQSVADPTHISPPFVQQSFDYFTIGGGHDEHMALYGVKAWEFVERMSVDDGRIKRVTMRKPA